MFYGDWIILKPLMKNQVFKSPFSLQATGSNKLSFWQAVISEHIFHAETSRPSTVQSNKSALHSVIGSCCQTCKQHVEYD